MLSRGFLAKALSTRVNILPTKREYYDHTSHTLVELTWSNATQVRINVTSYGYAHAQNMRGRGRPGVTVAGPPAFRQRAQAWPARLVRARR